MRCESAGVQAAGTAAAVFYKLFPNFFVAETSANICISVHVSAERTSVIITPFHVTERLGNINLLLNRCVVR